MKYKLVTLPRGTAKLPILSIPPLVEISQGSSQTLSPQTLNYNALVETSGYMVTISDSRLLSSFVATGVVANQATTTSPGGTVTAGTNLSTTGIGTTFTLTATTLNTLFPSGSSAGAYLYGTITVVGKDSGVRLTIPLKIKKV